MSGKAQFRLFLLLVLVGIFGYVGFLVFRERDPMPPLLAGERYYQEGKKLEEAREPKAAADKYDQAAIVLGNANRRMQGAHGLDEANAKDVMGRILYTKALALRDKHYALAASHGKDLPESPDSVTGKTFRNFLAIPNPKDRDEAAASLRGAAFYFLPKNYDTQLDALRLSVMTTPYSWEHIEKFSNQMLAIKDGDSRAKYMLAKFNYEQPPQNPSEATPYKSLEKMRYARTLIEEVRLDQSYPTWRTEYLRAQIHRWFMNHHLNKGDRGEYEKELRTLVDILLDDVMGAVARVRRGADMERLSPWDVEAILKLHVMAAEIALEDIRKNHHNEVTILKRVYEDTLAFCADRAKKNDPNFSRPQLITTLLNVMTPSQILAIHKAKEWNEGINLLRPMLDEEFKQNRCEPYRVAQFAELLMREAQLRQRSDPRRADELRTEARTWLDRGLKFGKDNNYNNLQLMPFNMLAANIVYLNSSKREDVQRFLQALQETPNPMAKATALVIDGAFDEKEGRLEKAYDKMEEALTIKGGDEDVRAHASLANIYMAMGRPDKALISLTKLQNIYDRYEELSTLEKEWLAQFLRSPQDYYALVVIANLDNARRNVTNFYLKNPNAKAFPPALVKDEERRVNDLLVRLPKVTSPGYLARIALIDYLIGTRRRFAAEKTWNELAIDYLDRIELLTTKVSLLQLEAIDALDKGDNGAKIQALPKAVDKEIDDYVQRTRNPVGKLYHALWFAQTKRLNEARESLGKIQKEEGTTPEFRRVVAAILVSLDTGILPTSAIKLMPRDPRIDGNWLDMVKVAHPEAQSALARHDFGAISRIMEAEKQYAKGDFAAAAQTYANAMDFTRVKTFAQAGLLRSMYFLAHQDPEKALDMNERMIHSYPKEPVLFLCYAYVSLCRDNIGVPADHWDVKKTMGSALDRWDIHLRDSNPNANQSTIALTKAELWFLANRLDFALVEANRARRYDKDNPTILGTAISIIVADPAQESRTDDLNDLVRDLKRVAPNQQNTLQLTARTEEYLQAISPGANPARAIEAYETLLTKFPNDHDGYVRLVDVLDRSGRPEDYSRALKWIAAWQKELPSDSGAASAKIRVLCRQSNVAGAREVADQFMSATLQRLVKLAEVIKIDDAKIQAEQRDKFIEEVKWTNTREMVRGFHRGGAWAEAESRLKAFPAEFANAPASLQLLGEIYLKQKQWENAEKTYRQLVAKNRSDMIAVNNLAFVLSKHLNRPDEARKIIRDSLKTTTIPPTNRPAELFPPTFLCTVGGVYREIDNPALGKEMMDFLKSAEKRYPNHPGVALWLGYGNELLGDYVRAHDFYEKAINTAIKLPEAERVAVLSQAQALQNRLDERRQQRVQPVGNPN